MGIRLLTILHQAKQMFQPRSVHNQRSSSTSSPMSIDVPKGHFAVYVGETYKHRFVVPISYLKQPLFLDLLRRTEEEYGFDHPTGSLTIPCSKDAFLNATSHLSCH